MTDTTDERARRIDDIHAAATATVRDGAPIARPRLLMRELETLRDGRVSDTWLEAMIQLCVIRRVMPQTTKRLIGRLRRRGIAAGDPERFDAFERAVSDYLSPERLTGHGYKVPFGNRDTDAIWSDFAEVARALDAQGLSWFLNSGTLLGMVRDGRLLDHDDDIDLAVMLPATSAIGAAMAWRALLRRLETYGVLDRAAMPMPWIGKLKCASVVVDIFPAWCEGNRAFIYPHTFGTLSRADIYPLATCTVSGHPVPARPDAMLACNYGPNWQVPDPGFAFPWRLQNALFADFLDAFDTPLPLHADNAAVA